MISWEESKMSGIQNLVTHWLGITKRMRNERVFLTIYKIKNSIKIVKEVSI